MINISAVLSIGRNPCLPLPCGPYSTCKVVSDRPVCSCQINYLGSPPNCRMECMINSDCAQNRACMGGRCSDPCPGVCGVNAICHVINHNPNCVCQQNHFGNPYVRCNIIQRKDGYFDQINLYLICPAGQMFDVKMFILEEEIVERTNPCTPSPCGDKAVCRAIGNHPTCTCFPFHLGNPPNCRPECVINAECPSSRACVQGRCVDPCPGSCGYSAQCRTLAHSPVCYCLSGFTGDPFSGCSQIVPSKITCLSHPNITHFIITTE